MAGVSPFSSTFAKRSNSKTEIKSDIIWKHKRENLALKRLERDLQSEYNTVKNIQRQYENDINKRQQSHRETIRNCIKNELIAQTDNQQKLNKLLKEQHGQNSLVDHELKTGMRKYNQRMLEMTGKYNRKLQELERKKMQINQLMNRYEQNMAKNESEKQNIEKELHDLRTSIGNGKTKAEKFTDQTKRFQNSEHKKLDRKIQETKKIFEENIHRNHKYVNSVEAEITKLDADLEKTRDELKQRERKVQGQLMLSNQLVKVLLSNQKEYIEGVDENKMSLLRKKSQEKVEAYSAQREQRLLDRRNSIQSNQIKSNLKTSKTSPDLHIFKDNLQHLQLAVAKGKNREVALYKQVRQSEHACQKLRRSVSCLQNHLQYLRQKKQRFIQQQIKTMDDAEREIQQKIHKETAQLKKYQAERDGCYKKLLDGRVMLKEDTHLLFGFQHQYEREKNISEKQKILNAWR